MKKRKDVSPHNVLSWILNGDGQGKSVDYKPFFHVRDVPSLGRSAIDLGLKTGRNHHYLSDIEYAYHVLAEYSIHVTDIREQFALLPWDETQQIAEELGIRHPCYPGTTTPIVITTDIVLTTQVAENQTIALSIKLSDEIELGNPKAQRTLEKLLIEKTYWERRSIPWLLCTEKQLPANRAYNLDFFRNTMQRRELDFLNPLQQEFAAQICQMWEPNLSLLALLIRLETKFKVTKDEAFTLLGRAVWLRLIPVDLDRERFDHAFPLPMTNEMYMKKDFENV